MYLLFWVDIFTKCLLEQEIFIQWNSTFRCKIYLVPKGGGGRRLFASCWVRFLAYSEYLGWMHMFSCALYGVGKGVETSTETRSCSGLLSMSCLRLRSSVIRVGT